MKGGDLNFGASGKPRDGVGSHVTAREAGPPSPLLHASELNSGRRTGPAQIESTKHDLFEVPSPAPLSLSIDAAIARCNREIAGSLATSVPRVAIGIDAAASSGVALWRCVNRAAGVPLPTAVDTFARSNFVCAHVVKIEAARWMETDSIALLDELLGPDAEWIAAVERPFGIRKNEEGETRGSPPTHGEKYWRRVLEHLARQRAKRKGVQHIRPLIVRPRAQDWRATLGIATQGDVKAAAIAYLRKMFMLVITQPDAAEAACIAHYLSRVANLAALPKKGAKRRKGGSIPMRFVA